jgi:hypothetical protein
MASSLPVSDYSRKIEKNYYWPLILAVAALGMVACALVHRHLYGDGVYFLIIILKTRDFTAFDPCRRFSHFILEAPLWVAVNWLHIANFRILSWIYGMTLFLNPLAGLWGCWLILKKRNKALMILPALCWACLSLCTSFFIISESWLGAGLFWPIYFLLLCHKHKFSKIESLFLVAMCFAFIETYEGYFLSAILLALLALRRISWRLKRREYDIASIAALLCLGAAICMGIYWSLFPRDPGNRSSSLTGLLIFFAYTGSYIVIFALAWFIRLNAVKPKTVIGGGILFLLAAFAWALMPWISVSSIEANRHANIHLINNLMPLGLALLPLVAAKIRFIRPSFSRVRRIVFAGFIVSITIWHFGSCVAWSKYTGNFCKVLNSRRGCLKFEDTDLSRSGFAWSWTMPCMSIALSAIEKNPIKSIVLNPSGCSWEPFNPQKLGEYPELSAYGVKYEIDPHDGREAER